MCGQNRKLGLWAMALLCSAMMIQGVGGGPAGAQVPPGSQSVGVYDPAMVRDGQHSPGSYYRETGPLIRGDRQMRPEEEEIRILIKEGSKVYCAWSNQLLHNDVTFREVPPEEAANYYDDGTHHDEIPFDGLPSRVYINNAEYLSPYAIAIKEKLIRLKERALLLEDSEDPDMQEWLAIQREMRMQRKLKTNAFELSETKPALWDEMGIFDPLRFYAGLHVVSLDRKTDMPKFVEKLRDQTVFMRVYDENVIDRFRGYGYYPDQENPNWERALWAEIEPESREVRDYWGFDQRPQDLMLVVVQLIILAPPGGFDQRPQDLMLEQQQMMGMPGMMMDPMMMGGPMPGMF